MANPDLAIYTVHGAFWTAFGMTLVVLRVFGRPGKTAPDVELASEREQTAPHSRALVAFHAVAFAIMYFGMATAVFPGRVPHWFPGQRIAGSLVIASGSALTCWTLVFFRSWRFRAKLDAQHQLATGGPFRILRHPIYMGLNLLALGTAIWVPTIVVWTAFVLMAIGSDLRGRAEEKLLENAFGAAYREYCAHTRRFVPGLVLR